jgi:single-stranded-DNA-specific exonuclease
MNWKIKSEKISGGKEEASKINPIVLQLLANRGISGEEARENFFHFSYEKNISDPALFSDMSKAVDRIGQAIEKKENIAIFGDYDADGVTATALLFETLDFFAFAKKASADYLILPNDRRKTPNEKNCRCCCCSSPPSCCR